MLFTGCIDGSCGIPVCKSSEGVKSDANFFFFQKNEAITQVKITLHEQRVKLELIHSDWKLPATTRPVYYRSVLPNESNKKKKKKHLAYQIFFNE